MTSYQANPKVDVTQVEDDFFLVYPGGESIHHLDAIGTGVWRLLARPHDLQEIVAVLSEAFPDAPPEQLHEDISKILDDMLAEDLVIKSG
ncbi:MAG: PqqD family protein [Alphaproteobacteria bacterium]|nr:PqqD family protein [Alphaproteobacteria bacterium]